MWRNDKRLRFIEHVDVSSEEEKTEKKEDEK